MKIWTIPIVALALLIMLAQSCAGPGVLAPEMRVTHEPAIVTEFPGPDTTEPVEEEPPAPLTPPPPVDTITLLPWPRQVHFDADAYASTPLEIVREINPSAIPHAQGYGLEITGQGITLVGNDEAGVFYAEQTLHQLERQFEGTGKLPLTRIVDWPDFPNRGVMLDISRDKVPTMDTLYLLVDMFASLKYNQLQLYTEHTFAYAGHEIVWQNASPMTAEEIRALDAYCRERHIELVPNQNSFGHMHRWLRHEAYTPLGETPTSPDLCPTHPGSIELLRDMYSQLLPNFSSGQINVGCDETFSLGRGCSKDAVERLGKGRVYLNFLKQIHSLVHSHGKTMQFWGDIILEYPELIPELPSPIIAMEWGYEANHPFARRGRQFAASGIPFYVCPGTSSWNSLLTRSDNALENLRLAAKNGLENGAIGYLITDWGDNGHWQFAPVSFLPFAYGAAVSWAFNTNETMDIERAADMHVFLDRAGVMSRAARELGAAHALTGVTRGNSTVYYGLLMHALQGDPTRNHLNGLSLNGIENARNQILRAVEAMRQADMRRDDAHQIIREFQTNARMALFALQLGEQRIKAGNVGTAQLPGQISSSLREELTAIIEDYEKLWLARNRTGGLEDSVERMRTILNQLSR